MKKLIAILLVCLLAVPFAALADSQITLGDSGFKLTIPGDFVEDDLTDEDVANDFILAYYDEAETVTMAVAVYDDSYTLEELLPEVQQEESLTGAGLTQINGIDALWATYTDSEGDYVAYYMVDGGTYAYIEFWYADTTAADRTRVIMESLTR